MYSTDTAAPDVHEEQHLFGENELFQYEEASTGQRFLNYLIDALLMQYGLAFITGFGVAALWAAIDQESAYELFSNTESGMFLLFSYGLAMLNHFLYYTFCEKVFKGYTLGKLITGTRAMRNDGTSLSLKDAALRSLSRLVPFEPFSAFGGNPWHDRWTNTIVVKTR